MKPSQVFIRSNIILNKINVDNNDDLNTRGLIDYVDFGVDGNRFLKNIGVRDHPTPSALAELLIDRHAAYFAGTNNDKDLLNNRIRVYIDCLKRLADAAAFSNELKLEPLNTRLKKNAWCLGFQTVGSVNETTKQTFKIVKPYEIYLDDNSMFSTIFRPLLPPLDSGLSKLYERFGAPWLSTCVEEKRKYSGRINHVS